MTCQPFEPEFVTAVKTACSDMIPFNRVIGLEIDDIRPDGVVGHIVMRPDLIGHYLHKRLHGGVISAGLDAIGGVAVMAAIGAKHMDETVEARLHRFGRLGTIDLRVDYLRAATGERFELRGGVLRLGSRIATVRTEFLGADGTLMAAGAASYIVA